MKYIIVVFILTASVSVIFAETLDPKVCHKRCMEIKDDKKLCDDLCYGKKEVKS